MGKSTISMAIFNSYVKLPEGTSEYDHHWGIIIVFFRVFCGIFHCAIPKFWWFIAASPLMAGDVLE